MKQCIAITGILTKIVVVDTGNSGTDNLNAAIECVEEVYSEQKIILSVDDLVPNPETGNLHLFMKQTGLMRKRFKK